MPAIPQLQDPLQDERVVLRDIAERDIPEILIAYQDDPLLHFNMGARRPPSGAELGRGIELEPTQRGSGVHATLTVMEPREDVCRGQLFVHEVDWEHRRADLAVWVAPQLRRRWLARSALRLAATWLLTTCQLARVQVLTRADNEPMVRAALGAGFVHEAVLRRYLKTREDRLDAVVLSLTASDLRP
jgi:RimJ/RimL family protein N-acetyltransferase